MQSAEEKNKREFFRIKKGECGADGPETQSSGGRDGKKSNTCPGAMPGRRERECPRVHTEKTRERALLFSPKIK